MLNRIVKSALRFRGVVIALACVLVGYGIFVAAHAKLDVFPEFVQPQVTVQSEAPGLAPEQVEALVTRPIESELSGVGNLESIRSASIQGLIRRPSYIRKAPSLSRHRQEIPIGRISAKQL